MSLEYEKYEPLKEKYNPFDLTEQQSTLLSEIQKQHAKVYIPLQAIEPRRAPFAKKYETTKGVIDELKEIKSDKSLSAALKEKKMARVWGSLSKDLLYDEQSMRELCKYDPRAVSLIPDTMLTTKFALSLLEDHAEAYDLLPKDLQTQDSIIEAYRDSLIKGPHITENQFHIIGEDKKHKFFTDLEAVAVVNFNPACPAEKLFSPDGLEIALGQLCEKGPRIEGGNLSFDFYGSKRVEVIPAVDAFIGMAKNTLTQEEFARTEKAMLDDRADVIVHKGARDSTYELKIMPLLKKHDREDIIKSIEAKKEKQKEKKQKHETFVEKTKFPFETTTNPNVRIIPIGGEPRKIVINDPTMINNENNGRDIDRS